jgi:flagellar hook-associated protein 2
VKAINDAKLGVTASVIQVGKDDVRLQLTSTTGGGAGVFGVSGAAPSGGGAALAFLETSKGRDAKLDLGGTLTAVSATNTFTDLLPGVSITVTKADPAVPVTVSVANDTDATVTKVQGLVDAANSLFDTIKAYTDKDSASASLKGDTTLRGLATQMLGIISSGVGGVSASTIGIQLTKSGSFTFDKAAFTAKLAADPAAVRKLLTEKTVTSPGLDGKTGTADDVGAPVGFAAQLEALGKRASDSTTGALTMLATSSDSLAKDLTDRIADWDTRLAIRKDTLTRQFTAMETALGTLQNKGAWLSSQINSLPSWSQSNK